MIRYPAPLQPGDLIGVTAPSSGVGRREQARFDFCVEDLRRRGYRVRLGACLGPGDGVVSAPAPERAAELTSMLTDPEVRAVVPPWGGELGVDLLHLLDVDALAADPTWLVGYSDTSTLTCALTVATGLATLHAPCLMDTPFAAPAPLLHWLDAATAPAAAVLRQGAAPFSQQTWPDFHAGPGVRSWRLTVPSRWTRLGSQEPFSARGRLVGGCLETVSLLPGSRFGDVPAFARTHAPEGLLLHLEVAESHALDAGRMLHALRLAGWFDAASAVLLGRTCAPDSPGFTQHDAVRSALGDLDVPVLLGVDVGHVPPQLALVDGALGTVTWEPGGGVLEQALS